MKTCPRCGALMEFSSEENEVVCEVCRYVSKAEPNFTSTVYISFLEVSLKLSRKHIRKFHRTRSTRKSTDELIN